MSKEHINTAYAERINFTVRNHLARLVHKTTNFSKDRETHTNAVNLDQIAEAGRRFMEENFMFEKTVENWKDILQDIE